jgi:Sulfotransferase domain
MVVGEAEGPTVLILKLPFSFERRSATRTPKVQMALLLPRPKSRPKKTFGALAWHLLFKPSDTELDDALKRSSFEQLREQEEKDGFRERPEKAERFFREGRADQWKDVLSPAQIKRIVDAHGEQMARFGYLPA